MLILAGVGLYETVTYEKLDPEEPYTASPEPQLLEAYPVERPIKYAFVMDNAPCADERYQEALDQWAEAGWPPIELTEDFALADLWFSGDEQMLPPDTETPAGNILRTLAAIDMQRSRVWVIHRMEDISPQDGVPDVCSSDNPTLAHEVGHGGYALAHDNVEDSVMQAFRPFAGFRFPAPAPPQAEEK